MGSVSICALASLWAAFLSPPESAKPWCYWWWVNGHVDRETITADLESMKRLGFGGVLMFDSRGYWDDDDHVVSPKTELAWGSSEWQDLVVFSIRECARLGLTYTMNASASGGWLNGFRNGVEYQVDVMDAEQVSRHLDDVLLPILRRVPDLVGTTFTHVYSVSYEGRMRDDANWENVRDRFYGTMSAWAQRHGLRMYSEAAGPWTPEGLSALGDCDQPGLFLCNDIAQGEFWPLAENATVPESGHANANARYFARAAVLASRRQGKPVVSMEAFTHMHRHYTADPAFLKPLADMAYADGANRLVWHTFTCSPERHGVPGLEYFAGSHINRNVTWQNDAAAFVRYLGRCQSLLQRGKYVDDSEFVDVRTNYYGWGRFRKDEKARFTMTHRRDGETDIFFVAGEGRGDVVLKVPLRGRSVELWDAVSVTRSALSASACPDGVRISLDLPIGGSCFLVVSPEKDNAAVRKPRSVEAIRTVTEPWSVSFAYHPGIQAEPPRPIVMAELRDLTTYGRAEEVDSRSIRYFSGSVLYRSSVELSQGEARAATRLEIGPIKTGLAHVYVNGVDCGVAWCAPWRVETDGVFRSGTNEIEIRYVNNWHNRLVGDCHLPESARVTRSNLHYWTVPRTGLGGSMWRVRPTFSSGPSIGDDLQPSGLTGPVVLESDGCSRASVASCESQIPEEGTVVRRGRDWAPITYFKDIVSGSALDFSNIVPRDSFAGEHGWVKAVGDHFECEGEPGRVRRFYGVNLCADANFPTHDETDRLVERLVRMGYNSVRLHHQDGGWVARRKPGEVLNETEMEKFDYLCARLIRHGLYLTTDLYVSRSVRRSEIGLNGDGRLPYEVFKGLVAVHEPAFENWASVATNFLLRTNVHTGRRYVDEPALAFLSLVNENTFGQAWNAIMGEKVVQKAWYDWVKAERAKDPTDVPAVLETLPVSKLGYVVAYSAYTDRFQADLERRMFTRMSGLLRSLGCRALLTNQNCGRRGPAMQIVGGDLYDYVDDHFYAPHPELPTGKPRGIYYVPNCNNATDPEFAVCRAAFARNVAKPFVATEFNFARPANFRGQGGLLTGAFAGRQDWSGLWRFAYAHHLACLPDGRGNIGRFDVSVDPLMAATERAALSLFLRGDMPRLGPALYIRPSERSIRHPANNQVIPAAPKWMTAAWTRRIAVTTSGATPSDGPVFDLADVAGVTKDAPARSPAPEPSDAFLRRDVDKGAFSVDTPGTKGGFAFAPDRIAVAGFSADVTEAPMTIWVSSLDGKPTEESGRLVLTVLTDVRGDGQSFADGDERWLTNWGEWFPEPLIRRGSAKVSLKHLRAGDLRVWALDTAGRRVRTVASEVFPGGLVFDATTVGPDGRGCIAYEIAMGEVPNGK